MPVSEPSSVNRLRERSFTVRHVTGEKRPMVFLHVAVAEVESLGRRLRDAEGQAALFRGTVERRDAEIERLRATLETAKWKLIEVRSQAGTALDAIAKAEHDSNAS